MQGAKVKVEKLYGFPKLELPIDKRRKPRIKKNAAIQNMFLMILLLVFIAN